MMLSRLQFNLQVGSLAYSKIPKDYLKIFGVTGTIPKDS